MSWTITTSITSGKPWLQTARLTMLVDEVSPFLYKDDVFVNVASYADMETYPDINDVGSSSSESSLSGESSSSADVNIYRSNYIDLVFRVESEALAAETILTRDIRALEIIGGELHTVYDETLFDNIEPSSSSSSSASSGGLSSSSSSSSSSIISD